MEVSPASPSIAGNTKIGRVLKARKILVATDFGGTLCWHEGGTRAERCLPEAQVALERLAALPGVHLAIVSGHSGPDLSMLCENFPPCWKISDHGRACLDPMGRALADWPSHAGTGPLERVWLHAETLFHGSEVQLERKRYSVVLRLPSVPTAALREPLARWTSLARSFGLELVQGRCFLEALVPGFDKRRALVRLSANLRCDFRIFAGDDAHDLASLAELSGRSDGLAVFVRSLERPAPGIRVDDMVDGPEGWASWLSDLADLLESRAS
jgi:trehalose-6-phosphatase